MVAVTLYQQPIKNRAANGETNAMMICVEGVIIPANWDERGNVVDLAIATSDEKEYLITDKKQVATLKPLLRQEVEVRGILRTKEGRRVINVKKFRKTKNQA